MQGCRVRILFSIQEKGQSKTLSQIAKELDLPPQTIRVAIKPLMTHGLVTRKPAKERIHRTGITPMLYSISETTRRWIEQSMKTIGEIAPDGKKRKVQ